MKTVNVGTKMILKEAHVLEKAAHELREMADVTNGKGRAKKSVARMTKALSQKPMRTKDLARKIGLAPVTVYTIGRKNRRRFTLTKGEWSVKH